MLGIRMKPLRRFAELNQTLGFSTASCYQAPDKLFKKIDIELRAHEPAVLKSFSWFATTAARELAVPVEKSYAPEEPHKERKTLLRAAFVNKKHRVQYEMRTFYHFLTLKVGLQRLFATGNM